MTMKRLKKERKQIILINVFWLCLFVFSIYSNKFNIIENLDSLILLAVFEIIILIAYFDNKKGIKNMEKIIEKYEKKEK